MAEEIEFDLLPFHEDYLPRYIEFELERERAASDAFLDERLKAIEGETA